MQEKKPFMQVKRIYYVRVSKILFYPSFIKRMRRRLKQCRGEKFNASIFALKNVYF